MSSPRTDRHLSNESLEHGMHDLALENNSPSQFLMPPPPVAMAASKIRIRDLEKQVKRKDMIIHALEAQQKSHRAAAAAAAAEKAKRKELAKVNKAWSKHNADPNMQHLYRSERITEDEDGNIKKEKAIFVTEYKIAIDKIKEIYAEVEEAEARVQKARAEQRDAYCKTQELIGIAEELELDVPRETRKSIARCHPVEDQDTIIGNGESTDSRGDVVGGGNSTATAPKNCRLILHAPKQERSLSTGNLLHSRLRLRQPKPERSLSVEETQPTGLISSQSKRKRSVSVEERQPTRQKLSHPERKDSEESPAPLEPFRPP
ncbi:hypothetical protein IMSHALPRED_007074 [Imshaugia aleurites]|uniref:Uncharacterized protein n=1 Tax=Imshaugia aleurites TaxID=172621 RepID=A0A8H3ITA4_9LECA|nr:hypothetical protein IMSHALPRED_007074 [Imshaugia aleurites]